MAEAGGCPGLGTPSPQVRALHPAAAGASFPEGSAVPETHPTLSPPLTGKRLRAAKGAQPCRGSHRGSGPRASLIFCRPGGAGVALTARSHKGSETETGGSERSRLPGKRAQPQAPLWGGEGSLTVTQREPPGLCGAGTPGGPCLTWPCRTRRVQAVGWKLLLLRAVCSREPDPPGPGAGPAGGPASPPPLNRALGAPAWGTRRPWLPSSYTLSGLHWPQLQALGASSALRAVLPRGLPARHVLVMATLGARLPGQPSTAGARCPHPG